MKTKEEVLQMIESVQKQKRRGVLIAKQLEPELRIDHASTYFSENAVVVDWYYFLSGEEKEWETVEIPWEIFLGTDDEIIAEAERRVEEERIRQEKARAAYKKMWEDRNRERELSELKRLKEKYE